jgi:hypothetical protein
LEEYLSSKGADFEVKNVINDIDARRYLVNSLQSHATPTTEILDGDKSVEMMVGINYDVINKHLVSTTDEPAE